MIATPEVQQSESSKILSLIETIESEVLDKVRSITEELNQLQQSLESSFDRDENDYGDAYEERTHDVIRRNYLIDLHHEAYRSIAVLAVWRSQCKATIRTQEILETEWEKLTDTGYGADRLDAINAHLTNIAYKIQRLLIPEQTVFAWKKALDILIHDLNGDSHRYGLEQVVMADFDYVKEKRRIENLVIDILEIVPEDVEGIKLDTTSDLDHVIRDHDFSLAHSRAA